MNGRYYILSVLILWANLLLAQSASFTASVSSTQVAAGEQFQVDFTLNGNGERFQPPNFNGFQVLSGPNVSQSMTSINGNTSVSMGYSFILAAVKEGDYTIGPATIYVNGHILGTRPLKIHVVKGSPQQARRMRQQQQAIDQVPAADLSKAVFLRASVSKTKAYIGEQLNVTYRLYTRVGILQNQYDKLPELNGFWSQDLNEHKQPTAAVWRTEILNGTRYNVADIKETIVFPERSGDLTIDPFAMTLVVRVPAPAHDIMEEFFGNSFKDEKVKLKSPPIIVHVKDLPAAGKPVDFSGAVGTFTLSADLDKKALKANESLNYNVKITGVGNIMLVKNPTVGFPPDFEKYDPKVTDTLSKEGGKIHGSKLYNYLLIPRHEGNYTIDPIKFTYFNPATERYVTLTSKAFPVAVAKGDRQTNVSALATDKQDVKLLDKDIRYIKTSDFGLTEQGENFFGSVGYYLLLLLGPVLFVAAFYYRKWLQRHNSDIVKVKSRKASKIARKHLANAQAQLATKNKSGFYEALFKGIYGYLSDKLNIPYANLDKETIAEALRKRSVNETLITRLQDNLDLCDMARFAPVTGISEQEVFEKTKNTINDIEDEL
ncbi:BatD family protein [Mucilaginibacter boryungensis]|uniref:Protein BatD n=1 Tax=Mucilaginibacter boryungensis TaxID=768480 RepID=A0ABR9XJX8_9SPHI|nr:BatD family protein [Mucilaginibacter boryungensis]MBE9667288.1 protein BatD [Mucilaginibacter boryungensis]